MIKRKWIVAAGAAAAAALAVGAPVASSWAATFPEGASGIHCYKHPDGEANLERVHLTNLEGGSPSNVIAMDKTPETWDEGQNTYVAGATERVQSTVDPKTMTEMTYLCGLFAGPDYRYAIAG